MRSFVFAAFVGMGAVAVSSPVPPQASSPLAPLEFLVGSCWVGTFADGKQTDEHCFEWMLDRKFIRDRHVVRNGPEPYSGETVYAWDASAKQITFAYYSSAGFILNGSVKQAADSIVFPSSMQTAQGMMEL